MPSMTIPADVHVAGHLSSNTGTIPAASVSDASVAPSAGIQASKMEHVVRPHFSQPNTTATSETRVVHVCRGAGTILSFEVGSIVAALTTATVTVDLKKNGTTVLSAVITLDSTNTARVAEAGTLSVTNLADGDVLEVVTVATASGGTLPTGVFASVNLMEAYAA